LRRHLADTAQRCRHQVVQPFANQFPPALIVAQAGRIELAAAVAFAADCLVNFGTGLLLGERRQRKAGE
jgi:hypothetical protein